MTLTITGTYAAILAFYYIAWSFHVSFTRARTGVRTGDGGNPTMLTAMRRHGNMAEYMPFALLMMALGEASGLSAFWLHVSGVLLVAGRLIHPFGITDEGGPVSARVVGQLSTYAATLIPAAAILLTRLA
jgi:uncharacterized membrane protein YecN with MAPEG domain